MYVLLKKTNELQEVNTGYAVNYLIPKGLAVIATDGVQRKRSQIEAAQKSKQEEQLKRYATIAKKLEGKNITLKAKATEKGELFGGINKGQIKRALGVKAQLDIKLNKPLKQIGSHTVALKIGTHRVEIVVTIEPS